METRKQGLTVISAIVALIATLVIIQLWILAATIESLLGGDARLSVRAAVVQLVLFGLTGGLLLPVLALDRRLRQGHRG
jgi:hypothetical protein